MNEILSQAAISLTEKLSHMIWFQMVGISDSEESGAILIVYTKNASKSVRDSIPQVWEGYKVKIEKISGHVRPL